MAGSARPSQLHTALPRTWPSARPWISIHEKKDTDAASPERWQSDIQVEEDAARRLLEADGFPGDLAEVLVADARLRAT